VGGGPATSLWGRAEPPTSTASAYPKARCLTSHFQFVLLRVCRCSWLCAPPDVAINNTAEMLESFVARYLSCDGRVGLDGRERWRRLKLLPLSDGQVLTVLIILPANCCPSSPSCDIPLEPWLTIPQTVQTLTRKG
jgi:hypothetical protein